MAPTVRPFEIRVCQHSPAEVGSFQVGTLQVDILPGGLAKVGSLQSGPSHFAPSQVGMIQKCAGQFGEGQNRPPQANAVQVGPPPN